VRTTATILASIICLCLGTASSASAQNLFSSSGGSFAQHHTQLKLVLNADAFYPDPGGRPVALLDLKMDAGWHTYWKNPGDAGSATKIEWRLPPGVTVSSSGWPVPQKLPPAEVTTYGYEDEAVLPTVFVIASNTPPGRLAIKAHVTWLECKDVCIPAHEDVSAAFDVARPGDPIKDVADTLAADPERARLFNLWRHSMPLPQAGAGEVRAWWEKPVDADIRPLVIAWAVPKHDADFYPDASDHFEIQAPTQVFAPPTGGVGLRKLVKKFDGDWPTMVSGLLVLPPATNAPAGTNGIRYSIAYDVALPVANSAPASPSATPAPVPPNSASQPDSNLARPRDWLFLGRMLLFAFMGGLILNIMPCVLPVIALKILGFVSEAGSAPRRVRTLGVVYAAGVLCSFLVLAAGVIGIRAAGHHAGWGMQFGSPIFVVCLITLVLLVALNLFGVFEVTLGGRAVDAAGGLASRGGLAGAFFNGVLATTLATPCTAPFLASALGFAFQERAPLIVTVFLTAGLGLAAPYLILAWQPGWLKFLPRPGPWMEKFKNAMGFPMLATVVWLYFIASSNYGHSVVWLGAFLVVVACAAWIFGEFVQRGRSHRLLAGILALLLLMGGYGVALEKELNWRVPMPPAYSAGAFSSNHGLEWQPWSPAAVAAARAAGQPVLVDFTADWCLTCQVNRKTSLEAPQVRDQLKALKVVTLVGDYTHSSDAIAAELQRYQRAGVPLVLVYPKNPDLPPIFLPSVLTPGIVLSALDSAR